MTSTNPNIILCMCDDLGYGDTGFNGNTIIQTPHLDQLREEGAKFTRFYAGGPVCSPTRGTCLTGRHYSRYGINHANCGALPEPEITLAHACQSLGYRTGHFGKWHLGSLTTDERDGNHGGKPDCRHWFAPPWQRGFETCFSTEAKVPTWNPMQGSGEADGNGGYRFGAPDEPFGTAYWHEDGSKATENLEGCDSRVIVDRVEPFLRECVASGDSFLSVVWFHAPHTPVVAGPEYRVRYKEHSEEEQHYYGCVTAMDEQMGRINRIVKELGVEENTVILFCSDNGPEGPGPTGTHRSRGVTGGLRGRKRSLFNGGVGVPALIKWPGKVSPGTTITAPCSTLDYLPTLMSHLDYTIPDARPLDGEDIGPLLSGQSDQRQRPIPYRFLERKSSMDGSPTLALMDNRYKFMTNLGECHDEEMMFDILNDPGETKNLIYDHQDLATTMREQLKQFIHSCKQSHVGADYAKEWTPLTEFQGVGGWKGDVLGNP